MNYETLKDYFKNYQQGKTTRTELEAAITRWQLREFGEYWRNK